MKKIMIRLLPFVGVLLLDFVIILFADSQPPMSLASITFISSTILIVTHPKEVGCFKSYFIFLIYTNLMYFTYMIFSLNQDGHFFRDLPSCLLVYFMIPKAFHSIFHMIKYPSKYIFNIGRVIIALFFGFSFYVYIIYIMSSAGMNQLLFYLYIIGLLSIELLLIFFGRKIKKEVIA